MKDYLKVMGVMLLIVAGLSSCKKESMQEKMVRETRAFSESNCPKMVDKFTTMDSTVYDIPTHTMAYYYTVSGDLDVDSIYTEELIKDFRGKVLDEIKNSIQLKNYKDQKVRFLYRYVSAKSGKVMLELKFGPKEYK